MLEYRALILLTSSDGNLTWSVTNLAVPREPGFALAGILYFWVCGIREAHHVKTTCISLCETAANICQNVTSIFTKHVKCIKCTCMLCDRQSPDHYIVIALINLFVSV